MSKQTVFFCHSHSDAAKVKALVDLLEMVTDSKTVFCSSDRGPDIGEDWLNEIVRKAAECTLFVALMTESLLASPWLHYECGLFEAKAGTKQPSKRIFIYLGGSALEPNDPRVPIFISRLQSLVVGSDEGLLRLVNTVEEHTGLKSPSRPPPYKELDRVASALALPKGALVTSAKQRVVAVAQQFKAIGAKKSHIYNALQNESAANLDYAIECLEEDGIIQCERSRHDGATVYYPR